MPDIPALTRIPDVELIRTGRWPISSGSWDASAEDLVSAVAALNCPSIRPPVLKLGHVDPRFDGEPAIGYVDNLRVADGGHTLVGDFAGVPGWLGSIAASAYPDRSVEGTYGFGCQQGHTHPFVLTAVALLGVTPPGVGALKSLQDVAALYGVDTSEATTGVRVAATVRNGSDAALVQTIRKHVAAADSAKPGSDRQLRNYWVRGKGAIKIDWPTPGAFKRCVTELGRHVRDPEGLCAEYYHEANGRWPGSKNKGGKVHAATDGGPMPSPEPSRAEKIRLAFNASGGPDSRWIVEVADDEVIVIDDTDRSLHRVPVVVADSGVTFGAPERVRMAYVPEVDLVAASRVVFASREESRPQWSVTDTALAEMNAAAKHLNWNLRPEVVAADATVLDPPVRPVPTPPDPRPPAEPQPPAGPPEEESLTPPQPGGVSVPAPTPGAEPVQHHTDPSSKEDQVSLSDELRSRLGLAADADEVAALAAIDALKSRADTPPAPDPQQVAASTAAVAERDELKKEVSVLASKMAEVTAELAATKADKAVTVKASVLDAAQKQGKFAPAEREQWEKDYDEAPAVTTRLLDRIAAGAAVPVMASGFTGGGDEAGSIDDEYEALTATLDGPYAKKEA